MLTAFVYGVGTGSPDNLAGGRRAGYNHGLRHSSGSEGISTGFDTAERKRFHNLLKLAAESPFEGEREAALAAAKRLAQKHGMSLDEAAAAPEPRQDPKTAKPSDFWSRAAERPWQGYGFDPPPGFEERWGRARSKDDRWGRSEDDKSRWRAAYEAARRRGLDREEAEPQPKPRRQSNRPKSDRRMNPFQHARALLKETTLPLAEIASITRLTIYQVVGLKLKMREEAGAARRA